MKVDVVLVAAGSRVPAILIEISNVGARLKALHPPRLNELIVFEWLGKPFPARVAWIKGQHFGLALVESSAAQRQSLTREEQE